MAEHYTFQQSELVTLFVPPDGTERSYRITGLEPVSGVYFVSYLPEAFYNDSPVDVAPYMNSIGGWVNAMFQTVGVTGMASVETQDSQLQIQDFFDVDVESTSGKSSTTIRAAYPTADFGEFGFDAFTAQVKATVETLDAAEAS